MAELRWFSELHRRHVVRGAIIYVAAVWALAQGIAELSPTFGLPALTARWFVIACAIGFPFWVAFAWYFRFTARGIEREPETAPAAATVNSDEMRHAESRRNAGAPSFASSFRRRPGFSAIDVRSKRLDFVCFASFARLDSGSPRCGARNDDKKWMQL